MLRVIDKNQLSLPGVLSVEDTYFDFFLDGPLCYTPTIAGPFSRPPPKEPLTVPVEASAEKAAQIYEDCVLGAYRYQQLTFSFM